MSLWIVLLVVSAFAATGAVFWFFGPSIVLQSLSYVYRLCYDQNAELPQALKLGELAHQVGLQYLHIRLPKTDPRLIPVLEQYAVLLNAQGRYDQSEPLYLEARDIYEHNIKVEGLNIRGEGEKEPNRMLLAQGLANLAFDYSSMLEIVERRDDAHDVLVECAKLIDLAGDRDLSSKVSQKGRELKRRKHPV